MEYNKLQRYKSGKLELDFYLHPKTGWLDEGNGIHASDDETVIVPGNTIMVLSLRPLALVYPNFISQEEAQHFIELGRSRLRHSVTGDVEAVGFKNSNRSSSSAYLSKAETPTVKAVEHRCAAFIGCPPEFIERLQVVRYQPGEQYLAHWDSNGRNNRDTEAFSSARGFQRVHTILIYLNDLEPQDSERDGSTAFPLLSTSVVPRCGAALYWRSADDTLAQYDEALHQGVRVTRGEKWAVNVWVHSQDLQYLGCFLEDLTRCVACVS